MLLTQRAQVCCINLTQVDLLYFSRELLTQWCEVRILHELPGRSPRCGSPPGTFCVPEGRPARSEPGAESWRRGLTENGDME